MPIAAVNEDGYLCLPEDNVGHESHVPERPDTDTEPQAAAVQHGTQADFGLSVAAAVALHRAPHGWR